jgi:hypothetical protein
MKPLLLMLVIASCSLGQALGPVKPATYTIAGGLPSASTWSGGEILITDGASLCDVSTGSGTTRVKAASNGTIWVTPNCGSGGSGSGLGSIANCALTITTGTVTAAATATTLLPCTARFGNQVFTFTGPVSYPITGSSTGTAYFYIDNTGSFDAAVGSASGITCSGGSCAVNSGTGMPNGNTGIAIWSVTFNSGSWNTGGGTAFIASASTNPMACGTGLIQTVTQALTTCSLDTTFLTLTTTGSSGAATYNSSTATLNIPQYSGGGSSAWSSITNAAGALTLANAAFGTTFNQTSAVNWTWANTTAATSGAAQASPIINLTGTGWTGSASTAATTTLQQGWSGVSTPNFLITGPGVPSSTGNNSIATVNGFGIVNFQYAVQASAGSANGFSGFNVSNLGIVSNGGSGAAGNVMQLGDQNSGHAFGDWALSHIIGSSSAPTGVVGAAGGTSPTCCTITGNDSAFNMALTTGTPAATSGTIMTVTFNLGFTNIAGTATAPHCVFSPTVGPVAGQATDVRGTTTATTFVLTAGTAGLTAATPYAWDVICFGTNQ